jgi:hypothetical protein
LGPGQVDALLRKWLARLPHPFTAAGRACPALLRDQTRIG